MSRTHADALRSYLSMTWSQCGMPRGIMRQKQKMAAVDRAGSPPPVPVLSATAYAPPMHAAVNPSTEQRVRTARFGQSMGGVVVAIVAAYVVHPLLVDAIGLGNRGIPFVVTGA
mmetsp:Transcript_14733/g.29565  ORF Transcript_14733/g.29565 Transcript_14733/m.29565 type:complete len:114 (+) Transcript_14733:192-533(+)